MGWSVGRGEVTVSRMERGDGQQDGEMGWSAGWREVMVSIHEKLWGET